MNPLFDIAAIALLAAQVMPAWNAIAVVLCFWAAQALGTVLVSVAAPEVKLLILWRVKRWTITGGALAGLAWYGVI